MGEAIKTAKKSVVTVVIERLDFCGPWREVHEAAKLIAPYAEGWRTTVGDIDEDGVVTQRYEREVSRESTGVEEVSIPAAPPVQTSSTHKTRRRKW